MTSEAKEKELCVSSNIIIPYHLKHNNTDLLTTPKFNAQLAIVPDQPEKQIFNFSGGAAAFCLEKMVAHHDL